MIRVVEVLKVDLSSMAVLNKVETRFKDVKKFNSFYKDVKKKAMEEKNLAINIRFYDSSQDLKKMMQYDKLIGRARK